MRKLFADPLNSGRLSRTKVWAAAGLIVTALAAVADLFDIPLPGVLGDADKLQDIVGYALCGVGFLVARYLRDGMKGEAKGSATRKTRLGVD